jgi:AraC-like DNA-binding protein
MGHSNARRLGTLPNASGTLTRLAYAHAKEGGIDLRPLLRQANLTPHQIKNTNLRLSVYDQITFLNLIAKALQDDLLGFHLAQSPDLRELGFLYYVSASSDSLGDALHQLARYASIANEGVSLRYFAGKDIGMAFRYVGVSRHLDRHQIEFFMATLVRLCRQLTGSRMVPQRVKFVHRRDGKFPELTDFFGSDVEFGTSIDEVSFAATSKDIPIVSADHHLNKLLIAYCEDALEQMSFSTVLERLKIDLADRYLADDGLSISQVAWLLGYQEVSSFTHAFKRWTSKTPRQARSQKAA